MNFDTIISINNSKLKGFSSTKEEIDSLGTVGLIFNHLK